MRPSALFIASLPLLAAQVGCSKDFQSEGVEDCSDADGDFFCSGEEDGDDCDDSNAAVNPGSSEIWYDGQDDDCDGNDDDQDLDGVSQGADCDDLNPGINPSASEIWYDGTDQDCSGTSDYDADRDGVDSILFDGEDCDDENPNIYPGAPDDPSDGIDQDCDGGAEFDADGDGYDPAAAGGDDCDDTDAAINPGATEIWYDGTDQDCDGLSDYDADIDGYDAEEYDGSSGDPLDCDDNDASVNPGVSETWYDGFDSDCDGRSDYDADLDGYLAESDPSGEGDDCDDSSASVFPGAPETWYDGVDADCNGFSDYDADGDFFDAEEYGGYDCDDTDAAINPTATEVWYDGLDSDCDEGDDYDADGDGYQSASAGGDDCDDTDAAVSPGATEVWYDGVDQDCAGDDDYDRDGDGYDGSGGDDCDDTDAAINPDARETLGDSDDSDCDGGDDSAVFYSLFTYSSNELAGPRIAENNSGVVIGALAGDAFGTGNAGALWHYLDPSTPWDGAATYDGWYYTAGLTTISRTYDMTADGDYVVEFFDGTTTAGTNINVVATDTSPGGSTVTTGLNTTASLTFNDIHASFDGGEMAGVFCEQRSSNDWLIYMTGTPGEFYLDTTWTYGYDTDAGGDRCAGRVNQSDMLVSNSNDTSIIDYTHSGTSVVPTSASSVSYLAVDYALSGTADLLAYATTSGTIVLDDGGTDSAITAIGTVESLRSTWDGTTAYVVYVNTSNQLYMVWGRPGSTLEYTALDPGFTGVLDADIYYTSGGKLVVAARGTSNDYAFTAYEL